MTNQFNYGYQALMGILEKMQPWRARFNPPYAADRGEYVLVEMEQAGIEGHHQVTVLDETGIPLEGIWIVFSFSSGEYIPLYPIRTYWRGSPANLRGYAAKTDISGNAQHAFTNGGEDIWVWDLGDDEVLKLPSPIVANCTWVGKPTGQFERTGVKLTFQRREKAVVNKLLR